MTKRSGTLPVRLVLASAIAGCVPLTAQGQTQTPAAAAGKTGGGMAPARDPDIAVQEEFDAARQRGTVEAWELFIARHPDHPLATTARQELQRLTGP